MPRGSKPGEYRGGRKKGVPNKLTAQMKATLAEAFEVVGGLDAFAAWGKRNPGEFYRLWIKLLPTEVTGADGEAIKLHLVEEIVDSRTADEAPARSA